ncbi:hypothetical protein SY89_00614 [Halolamina pelagica]|uniref:Small CPxCG-related zinc finger protein n=1 Tax=Halolamina pelagica TaxID=699431 RepID=A0A0P7GWI6_9EURY|nr:DUF6276 family protein [Halolamina pelagica]KPN29894.1 hypothetical protein SY89_00614 [Halolamina pelagica]
MSCPACGEPVVAFVVPPALREHAPAAESAICTSCLRTVAASDAGAAAVAPEDADFSRIHESFPTGKGAVAFALVLGKLDSLALNRPAIQALCDAAERAGTDVALALERLAGASALDPPYDIDRRRQQLASFR